LAQTRAGRDRPLEMRAYATLGQIANYLGEFERALLYFEQEQHLCREMGITYQLCVNLSNLGDTWLNMGDYVAARACYEEALATARTLPAPDLLSNLLAYRGLLSFQTGAYESGEKDCREALALAQGAAAQREQAFASLFLGHNLLAQQRLDEARLAYEEAGRAWQVIGDNLRFLATAAGRARVALAGGETAAALEHIAPVLAHLQSSTLDGADDPVWIYLAAYEVLRARRDSRAPELLKAAWRFLLDRANRIEELPRQHAYLKNIPSHRTLRRLLENGGSN
jgi:tetratricopeptide (TPR) repeat protein